MSSKHLGVAADIIPGAVGISSIDKLVLIVLAQRADSDSGESFPSYQYIAWRCGISRPAAIRSVAALVACGLVRVSARARDNGLQTSNTYELDFYKLCALVEASRSADIPKRKRYKKKASNRHGGHLTDHPEGITEITPRVSQGSPSKQERLIQERFTTLSHARGADFEAFSRQVAEQVGDDGDWPALATSSMRELFDLATLAPDLVAAAVQFAVVYCQSKGGKLKSWSLAVDKAREYLAMYGDLNLPGGAVESMARPPTGDPRPPHP